MRPSSSATTEFRRERSRACQFLNSETARSRSSASDSARPSVCTSGRSASASRDAISTAACRRRRTLRPTFSSRAAVAVSGIAPGSGSDRLRRRGFNLGGGWRGRLHGIRSIPHGVGRANRLGGPQWLVRFRRSGISHPVEPGGMLASRPRHPRKCLHRPTEPCPAQRQRLSPHGFVRSSSPSHPLRLRLPRVSAPGIGPSTGVLTQAAPPRNSTDIRIRQERGHRIESGVDSCNYLFLQHIQRARVPSGNAARCDNLRASRIDSRPGRRPIPPGISIT